MSVVLRQVDWFGMVWVVEALHEGLGTGSVLLYGLDVAYVGSAFCC